VQNAVGYIFDRKGSESLARHVGGSKQQPNAFQVYSDGLVGIIAEVHIDRQDAGLVGILFAEARFVLCGVSVRIRGDQEAVVRIASGQGSWVHLSQSCPHPSKPEESRGQKPS